MTGPDHYREGERLLHLAQNGYEPEQCTAMAQAHFTAALAAATALGREGEGQTMPSKDRAAWFAVAAECRKTEVSR